MDEWSGSGRRRSRGFGQGSGCALGCRRGFFPEEASDRGEESSDHAVAGSASAVSGWNAFISAQYSSAALPKPTNQANS